MEINLAQGVDLDAQTVMTGRGCAIGQSGSGKSFLAGVIAEELCESRMPFCVIDTEGEYSSLKGKFSVIVVGGERADLGLDINFSGLFSSSIANDIPIILDISDAVDKQAVAYSALSALYQVEDRLRKPYLILIEEADKFAPQAAGSAKTNIIEEISVRGRKRGMGLFITTQRPANISKNVLSQCSYGFVGKLTIENDLNALRILFGRKEKLTEVTKLKTGEFMAFGIGRDSAFRVKNSGAKRMGSTPSLESYKPASGKVNSILKELKSENALRKEDKKPEGSKQINAIEAEFSMDQARKYAQGISKRRFILFGAATERIDSIVLQYLPFGLCTLRIPTNHRSEYLEYHCLINGKSQLTRLENGITTLAGGTGKDNYRKYLAKDTPQFERIAAAKSDILPATLSASKARTCIRKLLPEAILDDFQIIHLPIYKITLRKENRVRIFVLDGKFGKKIEM